MMKLLIADDEPLVQIGLKSMIDWGALGIELCGTAANGDAAYELILQYRPEIVITDIQMPCSSGLELGKRCLDELGHLPVFIILTSYENFEYARAAMRFQAVDYLVKIDLSPQSLTDSVRKAIEQVQLLKQQDSAYAESVSSLDMLKERFYFRLLNNLFESMEQFIHQAGEYQISLDYAGYAVASIRLLQDQDIPFNAYDQTLHMLEELLSRYIPCRIIALDTRYLAVIFFINADQLGNWQENVQSALENTFEMLYKYYNVSFFTSIGRLVSEPLELSSSYYDSKQIMGYLKKESPLLFWDNLPGTSTLRNVFNLSLFRNDIIRAFEELDEQSLHDIFHNVITLLSSDHTHLSQAVDAAGSILNLSITLLSNGTDIVNEIFQDEPDSYLSLYRMKSPAAIITWLERLEEGLYRAFGENKKVSKNALAAHCCQYIKEHIHERIYLQDIADTFGVSPNYLSQLFKKNMEIGISEYITNQKIDESKRMLRATNLKIYEISDQLGFESSFYFSKVFKKITGTSPKDYRNSNMFYPVP
ncbi:MAG: response regulator transcription factor [Lachnospiraceae bacterium]